MRVEFHPRDPAGSALKAALRTPDGLVAWVVSAASLALLVIAWLARPLFTDVAIFERAREDTLFMLLVPLVLLASYFRLNDGLQEGKVKPWTNTIIMLIAAGVLLKRVVLG